MVLEGAKAETAISDMPEYRECIFSFINNLYSI